MTTRAYTSCIVCCALATAVGPGWCQEADSEIAGLKARVDAMRKDLRDAEELLAEAIAIKDRPAPNVDGMPPLPSRTMPGPGPAPARPGPAPAGTNDQTPVRPTPSAQVSPPARRLPPPSDRDDSLLDPLPPIPAGERSPFQVEPAPSASLDSPEAALSSSGLLARRPRDPRVRRATSVPRGNDSEPLSLSPDVATAATSPGASPAARLSALERKLDRALGEIAALRREVEGLKARR